MCEFSKVKLYFYIWFIRLIFREIREKIRKYENTKIRKYENTKIRKYENMKIQKYENMKI